MNTVSQGLFTCIPQIADGNLRLRHVRGRVLSRSACQDHWGSRVDGTMLCFGNEHRGGCTVSTSTAI